MIPVEKICVRHSICLEQLQVWISYWLCLKRKFNSSGHKVLCESLLLLLCFIRFENGIPYFAKHVYYRKFLFGKTISSWVTHTSFKGKYFYFAAGYMITTVMLCVHSDFCETERNQLLVRCSIADNRASCLNAPFLIRVLNRSTCDPYFKPALCSARRFRASSAAARPVELLG